ncbi:hypothetical protein Stsp01_54290 [Streptomyces sp. NBRC 13847]|nr:hypothetical protein Stsp01_54290 [Streptomyces sp. NBRC 13847]
MSFRILPFRRGRGCCGWDDDDGGRGYGRGGGYGRGRGYDRGRGFGRGDGFGRGGRF